MKNLIVSVLTLVCGFSALSSEARDTNYFQLTRGIYKSDVIDIYFDRNSENPGVVIRYILPDQGYHLEAFETVFLPVQKMSAKARFNQQPIATWQADNEVLQIYFVGTSRNPNLEFYIYADLGNGKGETYQKQKSTSWEGRSVLDDYKIFPRYAGVDGFKPWYSPKENCIRVFSSTR
jgi:hypothetical protein